MTGFFYHPIFKLHNQGISHPECPERLDSILKAIEKNNLQDQLEYPNFEKASVEEVLLGHNKVYIDSLLNLSIAENQYHSIDGDTLINAHSVEAAFLGLGAINKAVSMVLEGSLNNAFVAARPPGHHAEVNQAMGFCLFSNIALAALKALRDSKVQKVLILDFDVHHGNGTESLIKDQENIYFVSSFQHPFYPYRGFETNHPRILNLPLPAGTTGKQYLKLWDEVVEPWVNEKGFDLILVSSGFDGHKLDPLALLEIETEDFQQIGERIQRLGQNHCQGKIVSHLEGGYNLEILGESVCSYLKSFIRK